MQWIRKKSAESRVTLAVCNGAYWLAQAGLLDGKPATTMSGMCDNLKKNFPQIQVVTDQRFVDAGSIVTTGGLSAGIDGAFHVVEKLQGDTYARSTALNMEYDWRPEHSFVRSNLADKYLMRVGSIHFPDDARRKRISGVGDTGHWDEEWQVTTVKSTPQDVMNAIEEALRAAQWRKVASTSGDTLRSTWRFKGDDGAEWKASYVLTKGSGRIMGRTILQK